MKKIVHQTSNRRGPKQQKNGKEQKHVQVYRSHILDNSPASFSSSFIFSTRLYDFPSEESLIEEYARLSRLSIEQVREIIIKYRDPVVVKTAYLIQQDAFSNPSPAMKYARSKGFVTDKASWGNSATHSDINARGILCIPSNPYTSHDLFVEEPEEWYEAIALEVLQGGSKEFACSEQMRDMYKPPVIDLDIKLPKSFMPFILLLYIIKILHLEVYIPLFGCDVEFVGLIERSFPSVTSEGYASGVHIRKNGGISLNNLQFAEFNSTLQTVWKRFFPYLPLGILDVSFSALRLPGAWKRKRCNECTFGKQLIKQTEQEKEEEKFRKAQFEKQTTNEEINEKVSMEWENSQAMRNKGRKEIQNRAEKSRIQKVEHQKQKIKNQTHLFSGGEPFSKFNDPLSLLTQENTKSISKGNKKNRKSKSSSNCTVCNGSGYVPEPIYYVPDFVVDYKGNLDVKETDKLRSLLLDFPNGLEDKTSTHLRAKKLAWYIKFLSLRRIKCEPYDSFQSIIPNELAPPDLIHKRKAFIDPNFLVMPFENLHAKESEDDKKTSLSKNLVLPRSSNMTRTVAEAEKTSKHYENVKQSLQSMAILEEIQSSVPSGDLSLLKLTNTNPSSCLSLQEYARLGAFKKKPIFKKKEKQEKQETMSNALCVWNPNPKQGALEDNHHDHQLFEQDQKQEILMLSETPLSTFMIPKLKPTLSQQKESTYPQSQQQKQSQAQAQEQNQQVKKTKLKSKSIPVPVEFLGLKDKFKMDLKYATPKMRKSIQNRVVKKYKESIQFETDSQIFKVISKFLRDVIKSKYSCYKNMLITGIVRMMSFAEKNAAKVIETEEKLANEMNFEEKTEKNEMENENDNNNPSKNDQSYFVDAGQQALVEFKSSQDQKIRKRQDFVEKQVEKRAKRHLGDFFPPFMIWTNSTFCISRHTLTGDGEHKKKIYFMIRYLEPLTEEKIQFGLFQRCQCDCVGMCGKSKNMQQLFVIPLDVQKVLYPDGEKIFSEYWQKIAQSRYARKRSSLSEDEFWKLYHTPLTYAPPENVRAVVSFINDRSFSKRNLSQSQTSNKRADSVQLFESSQAQSNYCRLAFGAPKTTNLTNFWHTSRLPQVIETKKLQSQINSSSDQNKKPKDGLKKTEITEIIEIKDEKNRDSKNPKNPKNPKNSNQSQNCQTRSATMPNLRRSTSSTSFNQKPKQHSILDKDDLMYHTSEPVPFSCRPPSKRPKPNENNNTFWPSESKILRPKTKNQKKKNAKKTISKTSESKRKGKAKTQTTQLGQGGNNFADFYQQIGLK